MYTSEVHVLHSDLIATFKIILVFQQIEFLWQDAH